MKESKYPFKDIPKTERELNEIKMASYASACAKLHLLCETKEDVIKLLDNDDSNIEWFLDPSNMSKHEPVFYGIDLRDYIAKINEQMYECLIYLLIDLNERKVIAHKMETNFSAGSIHTDAEFPLYKFLVDEYPKIREDAMLDTNRFVLVDIHNHPGRIVAKPSDTDEIHMLRQIVILKSMLMSYGDSIVVTAYDCFSEYQYERKNNDKKIILNDSLFWEKDVTVELDKYDARLKYVPRVFYNQSLCRKEE